jgi:hypothetical protein
MNSSIEDRLFTYQMVAPGFALVRIESVVAGEE